MWTRHPGPVDARPRACGQHARLLTHLWRPQRQLVCNVRTAINRDPLRGRNVNLIVWIVDCAPLATPETDPLALPQLADAEDVARHVDAIRVVDLVRAIDREDHLPDRGWGIMAGQSGAAGNHRGFGLQHTHASAAGQTSDGA